MNKKFAAIGLTAGLMAGGAAGYILEATGSAGASNVAVSAAVVEDDAATGATAADRAAEHAARLQEVLQPLIDDNTLTQAQVDKVIAALDAARPAGGEGRGPGGQRGQRGPKLDVVATTLGITADDLRTALQGGQTIAEVAVANGKTAQDVVDAILADINTKVAEHVAAGDITQEQADAKLAEAETRVTEMVNNTPEPGDHPMGGRGMGRPGHGGPGAPADADSTESTDTGS